MNRLGAVVRLHLLVPRRTLGVPWSILALAWGASVALLASFGDSGHVVIVGGLFSLYAALFVTSVQAVTKVLPFALGLGVTRRAYYGGTCLFLAGQALVASVALSLLRVAEQRSGGWGTGLRFFDVPYLVGGGAVPAAAGYAGSLVLACGAGLLGGAISRRWGAVGTSVLSAAVVVVPGLVGWWIAVRGWFPAVRSWFADQPQTVLQAGWPTVLAAALALLGWTAVRRTAA